MKALIIIGCVLLVLFFIGRIRMGASVKYSVSGLVVKIKAGLFWLQIVPRKKDAKAKKEKQEQKKQSTEEMADTAPKRKWKDTLDLAMRFVPLIGDAAGKLKRKIRIDRLFLHVVWGASDPASAAMGFGAGNAAMGILWPVFEHNFNVKTHDLRVDVDFEREKPAFDADAQVTLTIGQILSLAIILGVKVLKIFLGYRRERKEEKAVQQ